MDDRPPPYAPVFVATEVEEVPRTSRRSTCSSFAKCLRYLVLTLLSIIGTWVTVQILPFETVTNWFHTQIRQHDMDETLATGPSHTLHQGLLQRNNIQDGINTVWGENVQIVLPDSAFYSMSISSLRSFLTQDQTDRLQYQQNRMDCDDFAMILSGNLRRWEYDIEHTTHSFFFCIAYGPHKINQDSFHAFNLVWTLEEGLRIVEPQTDEIVSPKEYSYYIDFVMC
jgi:hypothetical protein